MGEFHSCSRIPIISGNHVLSASPAGISISPPSLTALTIPASPDRRALGGDKGYPCTTAFAKAINLSVISEKSNPAIELSFSITTWGLDVGGHGDPKLVKLPIQHALRLAPQVE